MARILIIEDANDMRFLMRSLVERLGHTAAEAANGLEGLTLCLSEHFDLVICDLEMPVLDGEKFICQLKFSRPQTPVLIVSGTLDRDREVWVRRGATEFLGKPIRSATFLKTVGRLLQPS